MIERGLVRGHTEDVSALLDLIRTSSVARLRDVTKEIGIQIIEVPENDDLSYDHWICAILVSSAKVKVTFKVHFVSKVARALTAMGLKKNPDNLGPEICHDFMNEYCNLTAGAIKNILSESGADTSYTSGSDGGVMLPKKHPVYDTVNLDEQMAVGKIQDCWILKDMDKGHKIYCVVTISYASFSDLKGLKDVDIRAILIDDAGGVDFF